MKHFLVLALFGAAMLESVFLNVGCTTLPSEAQRANIVARVRNQAKEAETPGPRSPEQAARIHAEGEALAATVNSACLGEPVAAVGT